jgi:hypothetical protein
MIGQKALPQGGFVLVLAISVGLTGCAASGPENYSQRVADGGPQQCNEITEDDVNVDTGRTTAEGSVVGAVLGGLLGAALAAVGGGSSNDVANMAIAGGAVGAVAGGVDGYDTAQQKKRYAVQEARLACQLKAAKDDNEKLDKMLTSLRTSIDNNMKRIDALQAEYDAKSLSADEARAELASIDTTTSQIERAIAQMKSRKEQYETARDSNNQAADNSLDTAELDRNINDLNQKISEADSALDKLVERRKVAQIG